jgi:hypothetical protein
MERLVKTFVAKIGIALMSIQPIEKSSNVYEFAARIHEVEVEYVFLVGHVFTISVKLENPNSKFGFQFLIFKIEHIDERDDR